MQNFKPFTERADLSLYVKFYTVSQRTKQNCLLKTSPNF